MIFQARPFGCLLSAFAALGIVVTLWAGQALWGTDPVMDWALVGTMLVSIVLLAVAITAIREG